MRSLLGFLLVLALLGLAGTAEAVPPDKRKVLAQAAPPAKESTVITIVLVGDTGYAPDRARVRDDGVSKSGRNLTFSQAIEKIAPEIDGDINFANIETVVTDRNDLSATPKTFVFRMHPAGMRHLVERGFNLLSLANNHALDYGQRGAGETLRHMAEIAAGGRVLGYAGLGASFEDAAAPARFTVKGVPFAFSSMGIAGGGVPAERLGGGLAGQLNIHNDHAPVVARLAGTDARFRILSMHFGQERQAQPGSDQLQRWRDEISRGAGIDIIVGHHSHIPQGIEIINSRLIFYGMGNFLHQGMSDMGGNNNCRDWGVMAKVHLVVPPAGRLQIAAVEIVPVSDMHIQARPLRAEEGRRRIMAMNGLSRALGSERAGGEPLRLLPQEDGSGLYCAPGSGNWPEPLRSLCAAHRAAERTVEGRMVVDGPVSACGDGGYERVASTEREPRRGRRRGAIERDYADESVAERPRRVRSRAATRVSARRAARRIGKAAKVQMSAVRNSTR